MGSDYGGRRRYSSTCERDDPQYATIEDDNNKESLIQGHFSKSETYDNVTEFNFANVPGRKDLVYSQTASKPKPVGITYNSFCQNDEEDGQSDSESNEGTDVYKLAQGPKKSATENKNKGLATGPVYERAGEKPAYTVVRKPAQKGNRLLL